MPPLSYKNSLSQYRRYLAALRERPLLAASLFLVLSLILIIILLVVALRPTLVTIAGLLGEIEQLRQTDTQLDEKVTHLTAAGSLYTQLQPRLEILNQALPTSAQVGAWTQTLPPLASASGVTLVQVSLTEVGISPAPEGEMSFSLTASGDYFQLVEWLKALENLRRLTLVKTARFSPGEDGRLQLAVTGTIPIANYD